MTIHSFDESLRRSHAAADLPIWNEIYRQAFPTMLTAVDLRHDGEHQRAGIDRVVLLANSKQILVDEKVRWKVYPDIALEFVSSTTSGAPGWVCKPLRADYICYAIAPTGQAYLLPVLQLQQAWMRHGATWRRAYRDVVAENKGYTTLSCPVPVKVLFPALGECLRVNFTPIERKAGAA